MNTVYLQIYFITVSSVLGTGILGLPVTLYNSGFYPFLVTFILDFFMEVLIIVIFIEILQKAQATLVEYDKEKQETPKNIDNPQQNSSDKKSEIKPGTKWETQSLNSETELLPLNHSWAKITCNELEDQQEIKGSVLAHHDIPSEEKCMMSLDLHLLGEMFLCYGIRHGFDFLFIFDLVILLVAYSLAGSEAYSQMLGINYIYVIPVFTWCLALLVVFAFNFIQPVVSILTFFTASLFTIVVIVILFVSSKGEEDIQNNFNYIQNPFLMSTVTLGGSVLVMPLLFKKIENDASQIKKYRLTVIMGLVTCTILNILWCWAVLEIVPQHCTPMVETNQSSHSTVTCNSLESANKNGEISTDVLIRILHYKYPSFFWMSKVVEVFIMISITVSFMAFGIAMHHLICGIVESKLPNWFMSKYAEGSFKIANIGKKFVSSFLSLIIFGIIFIIATWNPKGFLDVVEKFVSSNLNSINILLFIMFLVTRYKEKNKLKIPLPLPNMVMPFIFLLPLYFGFAIGYDIYFSVMSSLHHQTDKSHLPELQQHLYYNSSLLNIIRHKYPSFSWVSIVVEVFIMIGITVSFMTIGTVLHHIICGIVESNLPTCFSSKYTKESTKIMNIGKNKVKIPLPLPNMVMPFIFLLPLYYGFAIGYDIYFSVMSYLHHETDKSHLPELQIHLYHNSSLLNVTSPLHVNATS